MKWNFQLVYQFNREREMTSSFSSDGDTLQCCNRSNKQTYNFFLLEHALPLKHFSFKKRSFFSLQNIYCYDCDNIQMGKLKIIPCKHTYTTTQRIQNELNFFLKWKNKQSVVLNLLCTHPIGAFSCDCFRSRHTIDCFSFLFRFVSEIYLFFFFKPKNFHRSVHKSFQLLGRRFL